mgnify:CR=1 FL=1|jgi:hypothetical protein
MSKKKKEEKEESWSLCPDTLKHPDLVSEPKRARDKDGKFISDDPSTPDHNEAWEGGKAPKGK